MRFHKNGSVLFILLTHNFHNVSVKFVFKIKRVGDKNLKNIGQSFSKKSLFNQKLKKSIYI